MWFCLCRSWLYIACFGFVTDIHFTLLPTVNASSPIINSDAESLEFVEPSILQIIETYLSPGAGFRLSEFRMS